MSWYAMHRGWMDHDAFADEPKTEREAWCWLIENAAYKNTTIGVKGKPITIGRGQLCHAHRFLSEKWKWPPSKTLRFLKKIAKWRMVRIENEAGQMLITICEYEKYQNPDGADEAQSDAQSGAQSDAKKNNKTNKQLSSNEDKPGKPDLKPVAVSDETWEDFLRHRAKKKAPVTQTAINGICREAERAGWPLENALQEICARGWVGFKSDWVTKDAKNGKSQLASDTAKLLESVRAGGNHQNFGGFD